jgi:hypothetical protein
MKRIPAVVFKLQFLRTGKEPDSVAVHFRDKSQIKIQV